MLKTNESDLVQFAVQGYVRYSLCFGPEISTEGERLVVPSVGGIVYNVKIGDPISKFVGDHIEPAVSATADRSGPQNNPSHSFNAYSCIGNTATVISGDAKGAKGTVTGRHGGVEHVIIDFPDKTLNKMADGDKIQVRSHGIGIKLIEHPEIHVQGIDPRLLKKMGIKAMKKNALRVPVTAIAPPYLMGSGLGSVSSHTGDYDIQSSDPDAWKKAGLDKLRYGDFVALQDQDGRIGWKYRKGCVTIGIVVHSDSYLPGHGPGVMTLLSGPQKSILPEIKKNANIGSYLKIGRFHKK